jgi:glycyl-tRNA synthetase alpha chain
VWVDGTEVSQFTFFQQMGGIECDPVCAEITYGPERLCLMLNNQFSFWDDLMWNERLSYKDVDYELEMQHNVYNFEVADTELLFKLFDLYEAESKRAIETKVAWDPTKAILSTQGSRDEEMTVPTTEALVYPALDLALKCSHIFNLLDARGAVSPTERANFINRIRGRVRACCLAYTAKYKAKARA